MSEQSAGQSGVLGLLSALITKNQVFVGIPLGQALANSRYSLPPASCLTLFCSFSFGLLIPIVCSAPLSLCYEQCPGRMKIFSSCLASASITIISLLTPGDYFLFQRLMNAEKTMADVSKFVRIPLVDTAVHVGLVMNSDRTTKTVKVRQRKRERE